ncbi:MAG: proline dehydrogenase family protein, partial [Phycisphaeraceae bacterium]
GQRLRVYVPFGELIPGMAYLVRRLLENTGSQSFLRMGFAEDLPTQQLLAAPQPTTDVTAPPFVKGATTVPSGNRETPGTHVGKGGGGLSSETFTNESPRPFTDAAERDAFAAALDHVRGKLGLHLPLEIAGEQVEAAEKLISINPADPQQVVGTTGSAGEREADAAVAAANRAFPEWSATPARDRARLLYRLADLLRQRRDEFAAWEVFEAGKPWKEADGDVCEAIDFINYYARRAVQLEEPTELHVPGETNDYIYEPRGPGVAIAPWNFPLAIPVGMSIAPVAAGNTVVLKPAPQAPIVTGLFAQLVREAGVPEGVYNFLPGGDEAGKALVRHKDVHFIAFTGSEAVGTQINRVASDVPENQNHLKHVIAEMGGKNAIIIDTDADLDDAVLGTAYSAFGYAGQKCSACSRVIVVGDNYEPFLRRLTEAAASLKIGPADDPGTIVGPVIDEDGYNRINATIDEAARHHQLALRVKTDHLPTGYFIGPTIFADVDPASTLAQDEIFGPVLAVMKADSFDHALQLANGTRFALTGGVYSRSPANLAKARRAFRVGNLYLNRKITGAMVNRQPFAGFKMSGTNSKAGGPDYLLHFLEPRTITENTIRRGFSPDIIQ